MMCEISDQLRLCTCAITELETLKDYWVLYRPDGGNNVLVGMTKLPANFYITQNESNEKKLLHLLNEGNCFDVDLNQQEGDVLELHLACMPENADELNTLPYLAYTFKWENRKWGKTEYDSFYNNLDEIGKGKIDI
jgi:hypothetical protein